LIRTKSNADMTLIVTVAWAEARLVAGCQPAAARLPLAARTRGETEAANR
jgi:hypothetical protein